MKKILIIMGIALVAVSCEKEEGDCQCTEEIKLTGQGMAGHVTGSTVYYGDCSDDGYYSQHTWLNDNGQRRYETTTITCE